MVEVTILVGLATMSEDDGANETARLARSDTTKISVIHDDDEPQSLILCHKVLSLR